MSIEEAQPAESGPAAQLAPNGETPVKRVMATQVDKTGAESTEQLASDEPLPWSHEELKASQLRDPELKFIYNLVAAGASKPRDDDISAYSKDVKLLCSF